MLHRCPIIFALLLLCSSCHHYHIQRDFALENAPPAPDYSQDKHWQALPWTEDAADLLPDSQLKDKQAEAAVDVFFVHPTIYWGRPKGESDWNAALDARRLNKQIQKTTIRHQASIFNAAGRIFAPKYRQAHLHAYYCKDKIKGKQALDLAYQDVKQAFQYYLDHFNQGRPFIIASHSQGTTHCARLLKEEVSQSDDLLEQMVVAYLVGIPIPADSLPKIPVGTSAEQTNCFVGWCSYASDHYPKDYHSYLKGKVAVNPLTWTTEETKAERALNKGGVFRDFKRLRPGFADAQVHGGMLWISKIDHFGQKLYPAKNYHAGDYNLFWYNVRENAQQRVAAYLAARTGKQR